VDGSSVAYIFKLTEDVPIGRGRLSVMGAAVPGNLTDHFWSGAVKALQAKSGDGSTVAADVGESEAVGSGVTGTSDSGVVAEAVALALAIAIADGDGLPLAEFFDIITKRPPAAASSRTPPMARHIGRLDLRAGSAAGCATQGPGAGGGVPQAGCWYVGCAP
jgi:hypothetical protein